MCAENNESGGLPHLSQYEKFYRKRDIFHDTRLLEDADLMASESL
jgi:hypothetical protein